MSEKKAKITYHFQPINCLKSSDEKKIQSTTRPESFEINRLSNILSDENLYDLSNLNNSDVFIYYRQPYIKDRIPDVLTPEDDFNIPLNHITLPFQEESVLIHEGVEYLKWSLIEKIFSSEIRNVFQLDKAIKTCNPNLNSICFDILVNYINYEIEKSEQESFFDVILPKIILLALDLPRLFHYNLAGLDQGSSKAMFLSQQQISSLLANAFLCTFPDSSRKERRCINFSNLFATNGCKRNKKIIKLEKLKCLINYLRMVTQKTPLGTVSFERKKLVHKPMLGNSNKPIKNFIFESDKCLIEDGCDYSQVDFANKFIGGGVLDVGCVQEEILFVVCPELIVSKLLCEKFLDNEALIVTGVEQFNRSSGYADQFKWTSSYSDQQARDKYGRRFRQIIAMDALYFHWSAKKSQYEQNKIDREIMKSMAAFQKERFLINDEPLSAIATGNWGCGVYNGDPIIKAMIQIIAASEIGRNLIYFTFKNERLKNDFDQIKLMIQTSEKRITVGKLYCSLIEYSKERVGQKHLDIVDWLSKTIQVK